MANEDIEYVTPLEGSPAPRDDAEILRGLETRLEDVLRGVREARQCLDRLAAAERADALRKLARIAGESGDAQHVVRHAVEALAHQLAPEAKTHRDLEALPRRRPRRLRLEPGHLVPILTGAACLVGGCFIRDGARGVALIAAGASLVAGAIGNALRRHTP